MIAELLSRRIYVRNPKLQSVVSTPSAIGIEIYSQTKQALIAPPSQGGRDFPGPHQIPLLVQSGIYIYCWLCNAR